MRRRWCVVALLLGGCSAGMPRAPGPQAAGLAAMAPAELRDTLAALYRAHGQKEQLAFYLSLPFRGVDEPHADFFRRMSPLQADLEKELATWAKAHDIDLTFRFGDDVMSQAQKTMEDRQSAVIQGDSRADLTRDTLIQMSMDYEFQISILLNLLPKVRDPGLRAYVEHSLKVHEDGSKELTGLLKRFKG